MFPNTLTAPSDGSLWRLPLAACCPLLPSGHTPWLLGHDRTDWLVQQLTGELDMCGTAVLSFPLASRWYDCLIFNLVVTFHHGIFHSVLTVVYCNDLWTKNESVRTFDSFTKGISFPRYPQRKPRTVLVKEGRDTHSQVHAIFYPYL